MNNLSWFLYLADVIPGIFTPIVAIVSVLLAAICVVILLGFITRETNRCYGEEDKDFKSGSSLFSFGVSKLGWVLAIWVFFIIVNNLIPSRDTIYLIAGSEVGEIVVNSPEAREILNDVKTVIKQQIKEATK